MTAEVRIRDVLDPFDVAIYRELAGGTTVANVLHGSANAIGGQSADHEVAARRRSGRPALRRRSGGIKFALGENPKQSNCQNPRPRYPATRMGVAHLIRERFLAARDYRRRQEEYAKAASVKGAHPIPRGADLQLEALAEILEGKRLIHCHSYRQDEILELIRTAEEFGVKVATFQHVLEGYKVADEIAKHGAGGSTFSDWWAYKFEVYDAIPYNGALMRERGVVVSFNSDSDELARRLNWRGGEGRQVRRRAAGRGARVRDAEPGEAARHRQARRLARARQGRRLRDLERRPALGRKRGAGDLDRGQEVLRPRGGPRGAPGAREGARGSRREGEGARCRAGPGRGTARCASRSRRTPIPHLAPPGPDADDRAARPERAHEDARSGLGVDALRVLRGRRDHRPQGRDGPSRLGSRHRRTERS